MKKFTFPAVLVALLLGLLIAIPVHSQFSQGGVPPSFSLGLSPDEINIREFQKPSMDQLAREDQENADLGYPKPDRMGRSVIVGLSLNEAGKWSTLPDGSRIWQLKIVVKDALALGVYFDQFKLPAGGKLFLYNEAKDQVIGAFTELNNETSGLFATQFIQGETVTLEYVEPAGMVEPVVMHISEVAYAYKDIEFEHDGLSRGGAWACMINVRCPEGDGWEDQIDGVARISIKIGYNYYWCSGSLINNTSNNRVPYFLTASHCGEGSTSADMNQWVFYFNYQATSCTGTWGTYNSTTGCSLKANDPTASEGGSDFYLVLLNNAPPTSYGVYYNGWNRTNIPGTSGVSLHHPAGDIKKVSTYNTPLVSSTWWNGLPSHWRVIWAETVGGLSIMQPGSSGSPIFDQDRLIMGDLTGGYASNSCEDPSPAWYGKIWYSWDQNGNNPATRLKDWLDPTNTGILKQQGISSQILPPVVDFVADTTDISQGDTVHFTDLTTGNPATSWTWTFEGGTPYSSTEQNPVVVYHDFGSFDVTLEVTNPDGTGTETKPGYINVAEITPPDANFGASAVQILEGETVDFYDSSLYNPTSWEWVFAGGDPDTSNLQNPVNILYATPGVYDVSLTVANLGGEDIAVKPDYITVIAGTPPTADFMADATEILVGDTVQFTDLSTGDPTQWLWTFEGGTPANSGQQNPSVIYNTPGIFNVTLRARNSYGTHTLLKEDYIHVGGVSVNELNRNQGIMLYPNPTHGMISLTFIDESIKPSIVTIYNSLGDKIKETGKINNGKIILDLSSQPEGFYFIRIDTGASIITRKISVVR